MFFFDGFDFWDFYVIVILKGGNNMNIKEFLEELKNSGYKLIENNKNKISNQHSDFIYQKVINEYKVINCYFYRLLDNDKAYYDYEFELYEEIKGCYCINNRIFSINKNLSVKEIENILIGNKN